MNNIITWCNANNGFLTAVLSVVGLLLSLIAIIVSIRTARLPYKKKLKLSSSMDVAFAKNTISGKIKSEIVGISVNAANIGSRNINITYLGIIVKDKSLAGKKQKMTKIRDVVTGTGIVAPTEIKTELYQKNDLLYSLSLVGKNAKIYIYATDSEGKDYYKYLGYAEKLAKSLSTK